MRFGLVGYGAFGRLHARCINKLADAELTAICCRSDASAAAAAADFPRAAIHRDFRRLTASEQIDVVDVVVPNHLHAEVAVAALEAGKDVLLEKPMANSVADCDRVVEAERRSGRVVSLGHELRLSTQWGRIKQLVDQGAIGKPRFANLSLFRHPYRPGAGGWRHAPGRVGSWILEEPVHFFDLLMWYFEPLGDPVAVRAAGNSARDTPGMYDNFSTVLSFPGGCFATVTQSLSGFGHHLALEIAGDAGALRTWWSGADARATEPRHELQVLRAGAAQPATVALEKSGEIFELEEQIRQTVTALHERRALVSAAESRKRVVVCLAAERSVEKGAQIALEF